MSKVDEIERAVEQLPQQDFAKLAAWFDQKRQHKLGVPAGSPPALQIHNALLNSYAPEDEGLYDDAPAR